MRVTDVLRRFVHNSDSTTRLLSEAVAGIAKEADLIDRKLAEVVQGISQQSELINRGLLETVAGLNHQSELIDTRLREATAGIANQTDLVNQRLIEAQQQSQNILREFAKGIELLFSKIDSLLELQKAEIIMQRDLAEAIEGIAQAPRGVSQDRENSECIVAATPENA
jgi:hypothetical protein